MYPLVFAFGILDLVVAPLPLATSSLRPSGVTRTEVGYHPTGMKPQEALLPRWMTSKTAMALMLALATKSVFSSGESARLLGVAPGGASGKKAAQMVSSVLPEEVSKTVTVLRLALAT